MARDGSKISPKVHQRPQSVPKDSPEDPRGGKHDEQQIYLFLLCAPRQVLNLMLPGRPKTAPRQLQDGPTWRQDAQRRPNGTSDGPKIVPRWLEDAPRWLQDGPQTSLREAPKAPGRPKTTQDEAQDGPRQPKTAPRRLQDSQRWPQDAPRRPNGAQDGPIMVPRWLQDASRKIQDGPRRPQASPRTAPTRFNIAFETAQWFQDGS